MLYNIQQTRIYMVETLKSNSYQKKNSQVKFKGWDIYIVAQFIFFPTMCFEIVLKKNA